MSITPDEYRCRYLNNEVLLFGEADRDDLLGVLQAVRMQDKVVFVYQDEESNPEAIMVSFKRYCELLIAEQEADKFRKEL